VLELALEISSNEEPDVEKDARGFKELLIVRSKPDQQIEIELDRVANLERELREERSKRLQMEDEKAIILARLETQEEGWSKERERHVMERKSVEEIVKERMQAESLSFAARLKTLEQTYKDRIALDTNRLNDKIRILEAKLDKESLVNKQLKEAEDRRLKEQQIIPKSHGENGTEIEKLRSRIAELEDASRMERELIELARSQANRDSAMSALQIRAKELEAKCSAQDRELNELRNQAQGAVPAEFLGPARGDYLRHIILRYVSFDNAAQKQALVPVIAMLLNLSPDEKKLCEVSAARDVAREGIIGTLTSSFQAMPIQIMATPRTTPTNARYVPVSTQTTTIEDNGD